ncbi:MAG: GTPase Era [Desulfobacteraceae bacterium]|nr:GTPase Era [Desulfobacteraceae bacterium]
MERTETVKSGFVALVGPPNAGKSTLLNTLLGQKISIVSAKPQTTRNRILGILNGPDHQIVFLDTPGLHQPHRLLNEEMVRIALETLTEVEVILFLMDATLPPPAKERAATRYLESTTTPAILLLNKIDLLPREKVLPLIAAYEQLYPFAAIIPVSALTGDGTDRLLPELLARLPEGPRLYPEDIPTDATERFIAGEIIREKIFRQTGQEVPYSTAVVIDSFQEDPERGLVTIHATIFIEKPSQKGILIGREGAKLKSIGQEARRDMEELLQQRVNLRLWVKVRKNWSKDARFLKELGL